MSTVADLAPDRGAASAELIAATRELMLAAATTDLDPDVMRAAAGTISELARTLGARSRDRVLRPAFNGPAESRAGGPDRLWTLFAHNPLGFPLSISFDNDSARAQIVPNALYEGPHDTLHGGFAAHLLDCLLGTLLQARGQRALTATLELRYLRRTPLDEPVELFGQVTDIAGRKATAEGWIEHAGVRTVAARGLFVSIDGELS